jgi:transposase
MAKKLSYKELLSNLKGLTVRNVVPAELGWVVEAEGSSRALCPDCGVTSHSRHSRYWRKLRDLPMQGASVTLKVQLGRWRCRSRQCLRQIFTERVDGILLPHSQQTNRLSEVHRLVGRALGGRSGQRLLKRLGMPSSRHTLLRQVIKAASGSVWQPAIRVVGVDDWAWRKGQSFGTILVDLERSEVVDLGERKIPGGQAALLTSAPTLGRNAGYQLRNVFSHSSLSTRVRICSKRWAPR